MTRLQQACYNLLVQHYMKPKKKKTWKNNNSYTCSYCSLCFQPPKSLWFVYRWSAAIVAAAKASLLQRQCTLQPVVLELWQPIPLKTCSVSDRLYVVSSVSFSQLITIFSIYNYRLYISISAGNIIIPWNFSITDTLVTKILSWLVKFQIFIIKDTP